MSEHKDHDYNEEAANYDATRGGDARAIAAAEAVNKFLAAGSRVVDIGGGTGIVAHFLAGMGHPVTVVDSSPEMIKWASARGTVETCLADGEKLPFDDGTVDSAITIWLLHIVTDATPFIREISRVLAPGGRFVTTVDKLQSSKPGHTRARTDAPELIAKLCEEYGLRELPGGEFVGYGQAGEPVYKLSVFEKPE